MRKIVFAFTFLIYLINGSAPLFAQIVEENVPETLTEQHKQLIENSETFQQYKVIPIVKVNEFQKAMADTLDRYQATIENIKDEKGAIEADNDSLQKQLAAVKIELTETQKMVDGINVFGMTVTKTGYNITTWAIIIALIALLVFLYLAFLNANRISKQAKNDKVRVDNELEELRKSAHEKQVKVKRELQTALNKIDEMTK